MLHCRRQKNVNVLMKLVLVTVLALTCLSLLNYSVWAAQSTPSAGQVAVAQPAQVNWLEEGKTEFLKGRKMLYNFEAPSAEIRRVLNQARQDFGKLPQSYDKYYWLAETAFETAEMADWFGDKAEAVKNFTESGNLIGKALKLRPKSSEGSRVMAESILRLKKYKSPFYMIQVPHAYRLMRDAVALDQKNYTAMNSLGMYYLNAPPFAGGSLDKAIVILKKALGSKNEHDHFVSFAWLSKAYQMKKNPREADRYFGEALKIYPNSASLLNQIRGKK